MLFFYENPNGFPNPSPLQIGMRCENTQSRNERKHNENSISFKMCKYNSLYNWFWKLMAIIHWYCFQKMLTAPFIISIICFKVLSCLFEVVMGCLVSLFTPWTQFAACQRGTILHIMHYSMNFWCYVYSQV